MKTLQQVTEDELNLLMSIRAKAMHLAYALESGEITEDDVPPARNALAVLYENFGQYGCAAEQYLLAGDEACAKELFLAEANKLRREHRTDEAAIIYVRIGEISHAIRTYVPVGKTLENILSILPQDKEEAERINTVMAVLLETDEKTDADYCVLIECYEKRGEYEQAINCALEMESRNYDTIIKLLKETEDYEHAAEVCLTAYGDSSWNSKNKDRYCFSAFEFYLKAGKFDKAIDVCFGELSGSSGAKDCIHSVYVAQGVEETEAWRKTAETIEQRPSSYSRLADSMSYVYEKAGMFQEAGEAMLKKNPSEKSSEAYNLFVASGMTSGDAARRVLNYKEKLYHWQVGDLCVKAKMWEEAVTAFEAQRRRSGRNDLRWDATLAPLYEKSGRWSDAADSYEKIGQTNNAIICRRISLL